MTPDPSLRDRFSARIADARFAVPLLPDAVVQILAETEREDGDASTLAALLKRDPALTGHLLKVANSPLYAPRVPIVSLSHAVSRLGMTAIRQIALLVAGMSRVFRVPGHEPTVRGMFRHSLCAAVWAQEIARMRRMNVEEAFLCGLFHDLGQPVLLQLLVDVCGELGCALPVDAGAVIDEHHARVGAAVLRSWQMSPRLAAAVEHHHDPAAAGDDAVAGWIIAAADALADATAGVPDAAPVDHPALAPLGLYTEDLTALLARRAEVTATVDCLR